MSPSARQSQGLALLAALALSACGADAAHERWTLGHRHAPTLAVADAATPDLDGDDVGSGDTGSAEVATSEDAALADTDATDDADADAADPDATDADAADPDATDADAAGPDVTGADAVTTDANDADATDATDGPCPPDMRLVGLTCMDRWEAPNVAGEPPLVMYTLLDAERWCGARGKRVCFDDEWLAACAGPDGHAYPYGAVREPGRCNDDKTWRLYDQARLNGWPASASAPEVAALADLYAVASARGAAAADAAAHVAELYQGAAAGAHPGCVGAAGVEDLVGNVEEWTRRRDGGGGPGFSGALVGRYWAESRTCQSHVLVHGDAFRFYEIGFRCCRAAP